MWRRTLAHPAVQILIVLAFCAALYWPLLGTPGLGSSEGHRVVPAWRMLESGEWFRIEMFGATYLRKPPGFPWAIAVSSMAFGQTEFAARAVSAASCTTMALLAFWSGRRWFGAPRGTVGVGGVSEVGGWGAWAGLGAGIAQAITPQFVSIGRLAEIDAFNALGTQIACIGLIELIARPRRRANGDDLGRGRVVLSTSSTPNTSSMLSTSGTSSTGNTPSMPSTPSASIISSIGFALFAAIGIIIAGLAKGPASVTCLLGVFIAPCLMQRRVRGVITPWSLGAVSLAAAVLGAVAWRLAQENTTADAVTQDFSEFTWSFSRLGQTALLIPAAFVAALPASLGLVPLIAERVSPWLKRDFWSEQRDRDEKRAAHADPMRLLAHTLGLAWLLSVGFLMFAGVSNARYAMPAAVLLPPLVAYLLRLASISTTADTNNKAAASARRAARKSLLNHPIVIPLVLTPLLLWWAVVRETYRPRREAGREAGAVLAKALPDGAIVWANDLIEARPDVLLYAQRAAWTDSRRRVEPRWMPGAMRRGELPAPASGLNGAPVYILLRGDGLGPEAARYAKWIVKSDADAAPTSQPAVEGADAHPETDTASAGVRLIARTSARVASYEFTLYEVVAEDASAAPK